MGWLLLAFFFSSPTLAADGIGLPKKFIGSSEDSPYKVPGGMKAVKEHILENILQEREARALIHICIRHLLQGNDGTEGVIPVLNLLLDRFPRSHELLEGASRVLWMALRLEAKEAERKKNEQQEINGSKELLRRIESLSSLREHDNVFFELHKLYQAFPDHRPPGSVSLEQLGVVAVGSSYAGIEEKGTGNLLRLPAHPGKIYLLSAAHLLDGKEPWVEIAGRKHRIAVKAILTDNDIDLAMAELSGVKAEAAIFFESQDQSFRPEPAFQRALNLSQLSTRNVFNRYDYSKYDQDQMGLGNHDYLRYRILFVPWAQVPEDSAHKSNRILSPDRVSGGAQIHVRARTSPGMSGSVLLENNLRGPTKVVGLLSQYNYYFADSYYSSDTKMRELLGEFLKGKRGRRSHTHWRARNSLLYRSFGNGIEEANFIEAPSGKGILGDPGKEGAAGSASPAAVFAEFGISPGMLWQGKSILGIKATPLGKPTEAFLLYANAQAMSFMARQEALFAFEPVPEGSDLHPYLIRKLHLAFGSSATKELANSVIRLSPGAVQGSLSEVGESSIKVSLFGERVGDPFLRFALNIKGIKEGESKFSPLVEAGNGKHTFVLDIRQFYFTDLSDVSQHQASGDELPESELSAIAAHNLNIHLPYRVKETGTEFVPKFLPADCSHNLGRGLADGSSANWIDAGRYSRVRCNILHGQEP